KPSPETKSRRWSPWDAAKRLSDRTPLRTKLITAVLVLVMMALAAISVASVYVLRSYLTTLHDQQIVSVFQGIERSPDDAFNGKNANTAYPVAGNPYVYAGVQETGSKLIPLSNSGQFLGGGQMPGSQQQSVPSIPSTTAWANANNRQLLTVPAQSGPDTWRVITAPITIGNVTGTLVVGYDLGNVTAVIQRLTIVDLIVSVAIIVVLAIVAIAVVRANLRPLNDIELTAGQIAAGHLDHRVPEGDPRTEIGSLGRSLNAMLAQIERAFHAQGEAEQAAHQSEERMRRFIADAAHELRTPLTTIRGFAAHYRQRGGSSRLRLPAPDSRPGTSVVDGTLVGAENESSLETAASSSGPIRDAASGGVAPDGLAPDELDRLMGRVEAEATRMGVLVEDLLTLARLDQQRPLNRAPVDLLTLAADAVQDARVVQPGRPIDLIVAPGTAFLIDGDEPRLRQVIANLVNNAITHTPAGTSIRVKIGRGTLEGRTAARPGSARPIAGATGQGPWAVETDAGRAHDQVVPAVVIDVEDDGPGMTAEQAQRVFERFYRADAARNRASGGTGLGLAIVAGLVSAHGGTVSVRTAPGQGADFQVKLPLSPDALVGDDLDDDA
ncbi:MAG TPA: HAMP domain-containing sensor histidine kinase, partial [Trebonia sp.]|nr:HAMP domain-containing sensor histidine kinase [Trebonia sp.]